MALLSVYLFENNRILYRKQLLMVVVLKVENTCCIFPGFFFCYAIFVVWNVGYYKQISLYALCMYVCIYGGVFVCMYIKYVLCTYIWRCVCMYICAYIWRYMYICMCVCTYVCVFVLDSLAKVIRQANIWTCIHEYFTYIQL